MQIKKYKQLRGFTMAELAARSGLPKRTLEDIVRRDDCLVSNAQKIASALDISLDELCKTTNE